MVINTDGATIYLSICIKYRKKLRKYCTFNLKYSCVDLIEMINQYHFFHDLISCCKYALLSCILLLETKRKILLYLSLNKDEVKFSNPGRDGNSSEDFIPRGIEESRNSNLSFLGHRGK